MSFKLFGSVGSSTRRVSTTLSGGSDVLITNAVPSYWPLNGPGNPNITRTLIASHGVLRNFMVYLGSPPGVGNSWIFGIQQNGGASKMLITISGINQFGWNTTEIMTISPLDLLQVSAVPTHPASDVYGSWAAELVL